MRGVSQANMDMGIFRETKLTNGIYTHGSAGCSVVAMDASSRNGGRVAVFYLSSPHFSVEAVQKFGINIVGFHIETGGRK